MGFGEIGRDVYQLALAEPELEVVAISDIGQPDILHYLLQTDGRHPVEAKLDSNYLLVGVNDDTVSAAVMLKVLDDRFGVKAAMMTSVHAYTSD